MYFPIGWPKVLKLNDEICILKEICCNRDRILFAVLTENALSIWFCKPCIPLVTYTRSQNSIEDLGTNEKVEWRPDSSMIAISTSGGCLMLYKLGMDDNIKTLYDLVDSPIPSLRRDSAELFVKKNIPPVRLVLEKEVNVGNIVTMICIRDELMISTVHSHILRYRWDGSLNRDYCLDLRRIPFCIDKQVSKALPIFEQNKYILNIDYSPLVGGFSIVFNDGRAAVLTASSLKFDPNQVQGIWAPNIEDATCCSTNHRYRLIVFGRKNSEAVVYTIDEQTGGLEVSHTLVVSSQVYPGEIGAVQYLKWSPDGCALALSWSTGGFSIWSTFGALLVCSLGWNYGLHVDLAKNNPLSIFSMEWSIEGYQLWMANKNQPTDTKPVEDNIILFEFLKSALTVTPCMSHQTHLLLQGADKLYINLGSGGLTKVYQMQKPSDMNKDRVIVSSTLVESKQWVIVPIPATYLSTNWPVRYCAIDVGGKYIAVAGRSGLVHYSMITRKWKLFGNETQEKDMVVTGGLLWWRSCIIAGCYSIPDDQDLIRVYPREPRLSNSFMTSVSVTSQILLIDSLWDKLIVFCADGKLIIYNMAITEANVTGGAVIDLECIQVIDISALCIHPACVISVTLTALKSEPNYSSEILNNSFVLNVSGRLLLVNQQDVLSSNSSVIAAPILLASCVENVWVPSKFRKEKPHLTEALWLFCGSHGMRVWLPLFPKDGDKSHTFMSKRIMLPFKLKIYPLAILFEDAILLGAENDTTSYTSNPNSIFCLPFNVVERTSQVYLHQILRQLIRRNLGFHAWEVARCCENLPYFPHSLELLLHEVLEEEATSKEPIPDAQLPSVIEFIQEFPVYLKTVVQCARKTEIALWPYLFSAAGKPKDLFQECLSQSYLETASSYLIILQNLESSIVSRQYAALLLDATLENGKWELSKDLVRFFRAIDPNDTDNNRSNPQCKLNCSSQTPTVQPNEEDLSFLLSSVQVTRGRSFSTATQPKVDSISGKSVTGQSSSSSRSQGRKKSTPTFSKSDKGLEPNTPSEEFFLDVILQRHARRLLFSHRLQALGYFAAHLDFRLVEWLHRERESAARVDNFIIALKHLHSEFSWPYPVLSQPLNNFVQRKMSSSVTSVGTTPRGSYDKIQIPFVTQNNDINSAVDDSGYMSCQDHVPLRPHEVHMQPHVFDVRSVISEGDEAGWWAEEQEHCSVDSWSDIPSVHVLEQLSSELSTRGSNKSDVQLRYLLQIFMEAGCLDWCLVVSILLRDVLAIHRVSNAARSPDQTYDAVVRLRDGFLSLLHWSNTECIGYKPLMVVACQSQVSVLNKILGTKQRNVTPPPVPSPAVRARIVSSSFDSANQASPYSNRIQINSSGQLASFESSSSYLNDYTNYSTTSDGISNDDTISVTSQKSTSSCAIS